MKNLESTLEKVGKILAKRHNITVTCRGTSCCTNGKTITLPAIPDELPPVLERSINGYLDHEVGHILHSDFEVIKPFKETHGDKGFDILNIVEDARVNRVMGAQYIGAGMNITAANEYVHKKITDAGTASNMSPWQKLSMGLCSRALGLDSSIFGSEVNEVVDTLSEELAEIPNLKSTQDSMDLAIRIITKLFSPEEEEPQSQGQPEPPQEEQSPQENSENNDNREPSSQPRPASGEQQQEEQNCEAGGNEKKAAEDTPADDKGHKGEPLQQEIPATESQNTVQEPSRQAQFIEECRTDTTIAGDTLAILIEEEINAVSSAKKWRVYDPTLDRVIKPKAKDDSAYKTLLTEVQPYISGLRQRLMLTQKGRTACRWIPEQDEGHINPQRLSGLITGTSSKVFKVKHVEEAKSIAVSLLIDCSGSMRGERLTLATKLAIAFSECLNSLNIPHEVIGFNTSNRPEKYVDRAKQETGMSEEALLERFTRFVPLQLTVYKDFNESYKVARGRFPLIKAKGLTPTAEGLMFSAKRLAVRNEERKILFCLNDGIAEIWPDPGCSMMDEAIKAVSKINKAGISVIGIGIQTNAVEEIFPQHVVINDLSELPKSFFRELNKVLTK